MKVLTFPIGDNPNVFLRCYIQDTMMPGMKLPAAVLCPGGAYVALSSEEEMAASFVGIGYHAFVLFYSVGLRCAWPQPVIEASMAMKLIREHADEWCVNTDQIVIAGFSAGGHVASGLGVLWNDAEVQAKAGVTGEENKPNAMLLCFPCINIDMPVFENNKLVVKPIKNEELIGDHTPPAFVVHSYGDKMVSMEQSTRFVYSMSKHDRPVEYHLYTPGDHGAVCNITPLGTPEGMIGPCKDDWMPRLRVWLDDLWHPKKYEAPPMMMPNAFTTREHFETLACLISGMGMPTPPGITEMSKLGDIADNPAAMAILCEYAPVLKTLDIDETARNFTIANWLEYSGHACANFMAGTVASEETKECIARLQAL